ncbi:MAG: hypothetical protein AB4426_23300 [Xenococcaceae cyanobacterium]
MRRASEQGASEQGEKYFAKESFTVGNYPDLIGQTNLPILP